MTEGILDLENIVNITVQGTPSGLTEENVNSLALFTTETPLTSLNAYEEFISSQAVATEYGSGSVTSKMANNIFSQTPNILTGNGRLIIIPLQSAVSATSGYFTTSDLTANLTNLQAVSNGDITVTADGVDYDLTGIDFTNVDDIAGVATVLQSKLQDVIVSEASGVITFTSKKVGATADVTLSQLSGSGTDLSTAGLLDVSGGTATTGADSSGETISEAITRTSGAVGYVGMMTDLEMEDSVVTALATTVQALDKFFVHHFSSTKDLDGVITTISTASQTKFRSLLYTSNKESANLMKAAYVGRAMSVNFAGTNTSQTLNLKPLANVTPDAGISQANYTKAEAVGADLYVSYQGVPSVVSSGGNLYFDQMYSRLALKFALEVAGFNFLRQTNTKIPQTEAGMDGLKNAYSQVFERFVSAQYIGTGLTWNGTTFGDPEGLVRNVEEKGYYIYSLPISKQLQADRNARKAPLIQCAIKEAGAIHSTDVIVNVEA